MNTSEIEAVVIKGGCIFNNVSHDVVVSTTGEHFLHADDCHRGESFVKLSEPQLAEACEIADAFPEQDYRRTVALGKLAQRIRHDRFLRRPPSASSPRSPPRRGGRGIDARPK